jgi:hypothetical protein
MIKMEAIRLPPNFWRINQIFLDSQIYIWNRCKGQVEHEFEGGGYGA